MKRKNLLNKKGFTLIELIVVIAILAVLALILVPSIIGYIQTATEAKNLANARTIASELAINDATDEDYVLADYALPSDCTLNPATGNFEDLIDITCGDSYPQTFTVSP